MKDLKDIILERRIKEWEIEGKKIPELYLAVFNDYLEETAESLADYTKQVRKEVVQEIRNLIKDNSFLANEMLTGERLEVLSKYKMLDILIRVEDQLQGEDK